LAENVKGSASRMVMALSVTVFCGVLAAQTAGKKTTPPPPKSPSAIQDKASVAPDAQHSGIKTEQFQILPFPAPVFKTAPPEKKKFAVQFVTNYTRLAFTPEVKMQPVPKSADTYKTPEELFVTQFSAMMSGDYDRWIAGWTDDSKKVMAERDEQMKRTSADWVARWKLALTNRQVVLLERLESGPYVLLVYSLRDTPKPGETQGKEIIRTLFPTKKVGEKWMQTQELSDDEMFKRYIEEPEGYTQVLR
jgi:hypothetical protein